MCVCVLLLLLLCVCVCVPLLRVRGGSKIMQHFQHVSGNLKLSAVFGVYVFALLRVCACVFRQMLLVLCLSVCVGDTLHDPGSRGPSHLKREILFLTMYYSRVNERP